MRDAGDGREAVAPCDRERLARPAAVEASASSGGEARSAGSSRRPRRVAPTAGYAAGG